jgi:ABC-2 type transport system permease protein
MSRLIVIIKKEFIHIIRDPRTLSLVIIMPVMMLFLLGYAVTGDIQDIPMAVADLSLTDTSRLFIQRFPNSGYFKINHYVYSEDEIIELMDSGAIQAGLIIPEDFSRNITTNGASAILFVIDGSNPTIAQTAQLATETISQAASQEILIKRLGALITGDSINLPINASLRFFYNPNMKRMNFMIPGLVAAILQVQTLLLTAFSIVREREQGTLEQLIVTPLKSWELMLGKILPFVLIAYINLGLTLIVGAIWFKVPVVGSMLLLIILSGLFLLGSLGLGVLISNISRTQMQAMYLASFIMLPTFILSGFMFPRDNMPWLVYQSGYLLPVTYFLEIVRGIIIKGVGIEYLWPSVWPMAVFSLMVFFISVFLFRKHL